MRRWCQGEWVWRRGWAHPQKKKSFFVPRVISLSAFCRSFLTGRKHGSAGTRILQFNREITKLTKAVQKLSKNSRSDQEGGQSHHRPVPEYATARLYYTRIEHDKKISPVRGLTVDFYYCAYLYLQSTRVWHLP